MRIHRAYRYRLYPTAEQEARLERHLELCRRVYNKALWWRQGDYKRAKTTVTRKEQTHALVGLKEWMEEYREMSSSVLEDVLKRVELAYKAFFRRCKVGGEKPGFPRSKGPGRYKSFKVGRSREFSVEHASGSKWGLLSFKSFPALRVRIHREFPNTGTVRTVAVTRESSGKWFVVFGWDGEIEEPEAKPDREVGVDVGLASLVATSDGRLVPGPKYAKRAARTLRRKQRKLARAKKGSNRRTETKRQVAVWHEKVANQRKDLLHNLSKELTDEYALIALEDLRIKNMVKNRHLANAISDAGWGQFANFLCYKAESAGSRVEFVDPRYTSQTCFSCGCISKENRLIQAVFECVECGHADHADVNAAKNILRLAQSLRGVT